MKTYIFKAFAAAAMLATAALSGCQADMDAPSKTPPEASLKPNTTILELKNAFADKTELVGTKENGEHYIIHGRVITSDASGNIYQSIVVQDETAALTFSVRKANMSAIYPLGQELVIDMTGMYMGYYHNLQQVGWPDTPYQGEPQLGFMAWANFQPHVQPNGFPNVECATVKYSDPWPADKMYMIVCEISELPGSGEALRAMQGQLVEFRGVHFQDAGKATFSEYQSSGENNVIVNGQGQTITAYTSGYSNFYDDILPEGTGYVRGILSYYGDNYQLRFRDRADINITTKGTEKTDPFTVADVLGGTYNGITGWTSGYIVGSVKAGKSTVTGNDDIIFGKDAELDNNLVIAASADETDYTKCITVQLPQQSQFRAYANLLDNPGVYKKKLTVRGTLSSFLGMPGIVDNAGTTASFEIEGVDTEHGDIPEAKGDGTEANPYNLGALLRAENAMTGVWVEGYVVGYVSGDDFKSTANFSAQSDGSSNFLNNNNIILSEAGAGLANVSNSAPVQVPISFKSTLGLNANPSIFGKKVLVKGNIDLDWLGGHSLRKITDVKVL